MVRFALRLSARFALRLAKRPARKFAVNLAPNISGAAIPDLRPRHW